MGLTLTERISGGVAIVTVAGDLDVYTTDSLRRVLLRLSSAGHHRVVIDLSACTFLDSAGLAAITIGVARARASGGELMIAATDEPILKAFRVTGLVRVLWIFGTAADAVAAQMMGAAAPAAPG